MIGDAAHAVTPRAPVSFPFPSAYECAIDFGQGCNIAIEDGEALDYFLRDVTSAAQIPAALEDFETIRIPRAPMVQFAIRQVGRLPNEEERKKAEW